MTRFGAFNGNCVDMELPVLLRDNQSMPLFQLQFGVPLD